VLVQRVEVEAKRIRIRVLPRQTNASCRRCGNASARVHSRYERRLADAPVAGRQLVVVVLVRRFCCDVSDCPVRTFAASIMKLGPPVSLPRALTS
jgi:transposase